MAFLGGYVERLYLGSIDKIGSRRHRLTIRDRLSFLGRSMGCGLSYTFGFGCGLYRTTQRFSIAERRVAGSLSNGAVRNVERVTLSVSRKVLKGSS